LTVIAGAVDGGLAHELKQLPPVSRIAAIGHHHSIAKIFSAGAKEISIGDGWGWLTRNCWAKREQIKQNPDFLKLCLILQ
jgi:hypothetical protein